MGHNSHIDLELHDDIEDLVAEGLLEKESAAYGIAQQVIDRGYDSLTQTQKGVWDARVGPQLLKRKEQIEWQRRMGKDD